MAICPDCGHNNIDGADVCEKCEAALCSLSERRPVSPAERSIVEDPIERLVPREPLVVSPDTPVGQTLQRMVSRGVGCAVVVANHEVVGIFTEKDLLFELNVDFLELADRPVSEFMTRSVETLDLDDPIAYALHKMDLGGYRHIPILAECRIAGIISVRDILNHITAAI